MSRDYANASEISILLDISGDTIKITVADNGRGFNAEQAFSSEEGSHDPRSGALVTLREKYELIGGALTTFSGEDQGTEVRLELPASDD